MPFKTFCSYSSPKTKVLLLALATSVAMITAGCGMGVKASAGSGLADAGALGGAVHGGQSALQGATVTLYATSASATGYGQAGSVIGTATTDANGFFTISPSATPITCPSGQQAYITAAGGYPSGNSLLENDSTLMMAALGDCANVNASTFVVINEVTTVAAAYALSGFTTTSTSGALYVANVSAPAQNNAPLTGTASAAAGLAHAFLNAANLADFPSGQAKASFPLTVSATTVAATVPQAEINTLGNIMQACVNGVTGNAECTSLFGFTPSITGVAPQNTLQSMINLARNPYPSTAAMTAASGIFSIVPAAGAAFSPALTAQPPDWSIAVIYRATPVAAPFIAPYDLALDADDTLYYGGSAAATIVGVSAYGVSTPAFTAGSVGTATRQLAPDALGNIWVTTNNTNLLQYSNAGGAPTKEYTIASGGIAGVAVDRSNNVWVANAVAASPTIVEYAYSAGTYTPNYTAAVSTFEPVSLAIDQNQNVWAAQYYTSSTTSLVLPNLNAGTASIPSYATTGTAITPVYVTLTNGTGIPKPLGLVVDASGNAWFGLTGSNTTATTGLEEVIPTTASSVITALTAQAPITTTALGAKASQLPGIDGAGTIFIPDNQGTGGLGVHVYSTVAGTSSSLTSSQVLSPPQGYLGCQLITTATTCGTGATASNAAVYNPRQVVIDSTGSVWAGITSSGVTQLIGLGAPTWPLLSVGQPGVAPGLSAPAPLP